MVFGADLGRVLATDQLIETIAPGHIETVHRDAQLPERGHDAA